MEVQMRSNDIFYGLTFDAPFFAFVHQHMYLWLKDTYPTLSLGTYTHFADNIHFYEQHDVIQLTKEGIEFFLTVNNTIKNTDSKQRDYYNILCDYLNIRLQKIENENTNTEVKVI